MTAQRQYESATVFNCRVADMRHLWTPSTSYRGQQTQKPNYFAMFIVQKTQGHWSQEPVFASVWGAFSKLLQGSLQWTANNPSAINWPIADGDMPSPEGKSSEFAKGHWLFSASTGNMPNVELVQAGGQLVKLQNKTGVKSGDYCMAGVTAAVKQNDPRGVKLYLNAVVFSAPGEEIVFANSVSGAELMRMAQQQGLQVAGFAGSPGFGSAPGGFPNGPAPQTFTPPQQMGAPGFTPANNGFVPGPQNAFQPGNPATSIAPVQFGTAGNGSARFPSSDPASQGAFPPFNAPR